MFEGKVREEALGARMGRMSMCWWAERMEATEEWLGCQGTWQTWLPQKREEGGERGES